MHRFAHALCFSVLSLLLSACSLESWTTWQDDIPWPLKDLTSTPNDRAIRQGGGQVMIRGYEHKILLSISTVFESNSARFLPGASAQLQEVIAYLKLCPHADVIVAAYNPPIYGREMARRLSMARAKAIVSYLWANGVSDARLNAFGVGQRDPVAHNNRLRGYELNRRIEVTF